MMPKRRDFAGTVRTGTGPAPGRRGQHWPGSRPAPSLSHKAILARMRLLHDQGQFAAAERLIIDAALDPRNDAAHVRVLLVPIFSQLGRLDEAQRLLEDWWEQLDKIGEGASERAIDQLRMHMELALQSQSGRGTSRLSRPGVR